MATTILVSHHSEPTVPLLPPPYVEICNTNQGQHPAGFEVYDDSFADNISEKNKTYCELSPLYSYWKQGLITETFGLAHYRRIFCLNDLTGGQGIIGLPFDQRYGVAMAQIGHFEAYADKMVVGSTYLDNFSVMGQFQKTHPDLFEFFTVACKKFVEMNPGMDDVEEFFGQYQHLNHCNMFIAPKDIVERWCSILFDFLFAIEDSAPKNLSGYDFRWAGFFSERFFTYFVNVALKDIEIVVKPIAMFR